MRKKGRIIVLGLIVTLFVTVVQFKVYASEESPAIADGIIEEEAVLQKEVYAALLESNLSVSGSNTEENSDASTSEEDVVVVTSSGTYIPYEGAKYSLCYSMTDSGVSIDGIADYVSKEDLGRLVIPEEINGVAVTRIGRSAFYDCNGFSGELMIPESMISIGQFAFSGCSGLSGDLTIPSSVTTIGKCAFRNCSGFGGGLTISSNITNIDDETFRGCSGLSGKLIIPVGVRNIGRGAFSGCSGFSGDLTIPSSVVSIDGNAFFGCRGLDGELKILSGVTSIGYGAFSYCNGFSGELIIPDSVTSIGNSAFFGCSGFSGDLIIPNSVTYIGESTFYNCSGFSGELVISNSVISIGECAFYGCSGFSGDLIIPDSVTSIGDWAFFECSGLTGKLVIPNSVTSIGRYAFYKCSGFNGELVISNGVISIGDGAFRELDGLTGKMVIPSSVISIGEYAFYKCSGFNGELVISSSVTSIGDSAFRECSGLTGKLTIPDSVITIGNSAFSGCSGFSGELLISDSVISIGYGVFRECSGLTGKLTIPDSVMTIGSSAFDGCSGFSGDLVIPNSVTSIGSYAFYKCSGFSGDLVIPDSVTSIGSYAFYKCSGFSGDLVIPDSVTSIGSYAFYKCSGFSGDLIISNSLVSIDDSVFYKCSGFRGDLIIPSSVTNIDDDAFDGCNGFRSAHFQGAPPEGIIDLAGVLSGNLSSDTFLYYPFNISGWDTIVTENTWYNWVPYAVGVDPILPNLWFLLDTDIEDLSYSYETGYSVAQMNLDVSAVYMEVDNSITYDNVNMLVELPDGLSFSESEDSKTVINILGTIDNTNSRRDMTYPVYITLDDVMDEFVVTLQLTADGYETPQTYTYSIPVELINNKAEESIIDVVEKYTNDQEVEAVMQIINSSLSTEEKIQKLYEYYNYDNIFDLKEKLIEISDTSEERWSYIGLTTDELYHSWQWYYYLNETPKGIAARVSLYASGLAFNGELSAWLDPSTYLDAEYPGVDKYKSMLEDFIQVQNQTIEYHSYLKETEKFINSSIGVWSSVEKGEILKELGKTKSTVELKSVFNNFVESKWKTSSGKTVHIKCEEETPFTMAMGGVHDGFKIVNATVEGVMAMVDVASNLETYEVYKDFLSDISEEEDLPWEMRVAAFKLMVELEAGYAAPMLEIVNEIRDECMGEALDVAGLDKILGLNGLVSTIDFSAFCMNQFVDIGELVVRSAHTEGYAILAMYYEDKLEQCKQQFLADKTEANAWEFYETYIMLWNLRVEGEKMYLSMNQLDANEVVTNVSEGLEIRTLNDVISEACHYADKEASVSRMLDTLNTFKFKYKIMTAEIPEEYKYLQKIVVECPVSVEFLTEAGESVCLLDDKVENDITNEHGRFVSVYRPTTGDYVKIAYLENATPYKVKVIGQEDGKVSYSYAQTTDHQSYTIGGFDKVTISENSIIELATNENIYKVDKDGDGNTDIEAQQVDKNKVSVQFDCQNGKQILTCYADEDGYITMPLNPDFAGYKFEGWFTEINGQGVSFVEDIAIEDSITVYAYWTKEDVSVEPTPVPTQTPKPMQTPEPTPEKVTHKVGVTLKDNTTNAQYKVTAKNTVEYSKPIDKTKTTVTIPSTVKIDGITYKVTSIASSAFKGNKKITKVTIGSNVKTIGKQAFSGCTKLKTVTIGKNVTTISDQAFYKCTSLTKITIPAKVTKIGKQAFSGCAKLKTVTIGKNVTTIGDQAFYKCTSLTKITIPAKVTKIGKQAFYGDKKLKTVTIKTTKLTTKNVGSQAFKGINTSATIKVPKSKAKAYTTLFKKKGVTGKRQKIK